MKRSLLVILLILISCSKSDSDIFAEARLAESKNDIQLQYETYKIIVDDFPKSKFHAESLFRMGYICANDLKKYDEAKILFNSFLEKYPVHELKMAAEFEIKNMGVPIEQLSIFNKIMSDSSIVKNR